MDVFDLRKRLVDDYSKYILCNDNLNLRAADVSEHLRIGYNTAQLETSVPPNYAVFPHWRS